MSCHNTTTSRCHVTSGLVIVAVAALLVDDGLTLTRNMYGWISGLVMVADANRLSEFGLSQPDLNLCPAAERAHEVPPALQGTLGETPPISTFFWA